MNSRRLKFLGRDNKWKLLLTLGLAVVLPAAALVFTNYHHLKSIKRDNVLDAAFHRDFQYMLAISEKKINQKVYAMTEAARDSFPSPDTDPEPERTRKLDQILAGNPWLHHAFLYDAEKGLVLRSQVRQMDEKRREEVVKMTQAYRGWFAIEGGWLLEQMHKKNPHFYCQGSEGKPEEGYLVSVFFPLTHSGKRVVFGGIHFDPTYVKQTFFPEILDELIASKLSEARENRLDLAVYTTGQEGKYAGKFLAATPGWGEGKPEVSRKLDDVFRGLSLGIKFRETTVAALSQSWLYRSYLILAVLSLLMVGGLVLVYRSVTKEVALARLKSDFVSNVSHELRTPLALIRLYAETLELGRITTEQKKEEYYRIIRKESERLTALINNILDFSRIEAGRKEYDFRETDLAELVRNTLDSYRYQIEQQGFALEQNIDSNIPPVRVDREAIARALVNLINNALKYSATEKFLGVRLYQESGVLKLEVIDRGIGIMGREQSKIFEKFYRTGDPLVHNTKGSGLGLSLVRHITQAHGGAVEVESTPGKGSKFTLSLPIVPAT
jgi:signal transduction histidine kinase